MSSGSSDFPLLRLLQLFSPSLPVGGYSYSQALEWAVGEEWITDVDHFTQWLNEQLGGMISQQDLPLLVRLYRCVANGANDDCEYWDSMAIAMRETSELRREELQRGQAVGSLLRSLQVPMPLKPKSQLGGIAMFCVAENIPLSDTLTGYAYNWLDGQVTAAIKLFPIGQSQGQGILYQFSSKIPAVVQQAMSVEDQEIGYTSPGLTIASCLHETQYTRLFRS